MSSPLIQYYFTQFIGDATASPLPTIKGLAAFKGIALIDTDVYIPGGNGSEWYINQNQFFRQIRNLAIDLTDMPNENVSGDQTYVPTGIHWQVAQSTSMQNVAITMPLGGGTTAVGIFTENGSGGFMSDMSFFGGNIGMRVGSQQFTARGLTFTLQATAVSMIWDWGWTWQDIYVNAAYIAFDCTSFGGPVNGAQVQGTGSLTVIDSHFSSVPYAITVGPTLQPAILLDNLLIDGNTPSVVLVSGGETILPGTSGPAVTIASWAMGRQYSGPDDGGTSTAGSLSPALRKPAALLDPSDRHMHFTRSKPQYEALSAAAFVSVASYGAVGDGKSDATSALNAAFGAVVFVPAGVYMVSSTVFIPVGTRVVGELWPQIMAHGRAFSDASAPVPVVQVGRPGDVGVLEMSDLLVTVQGPAPGAVMVEWNVKQSSQGSAGMWDSHVRVGGAIGSNMQAAQCPAQSVYDAECAGAAMMMHVNTWFRVADHDLDNSAQPQINVFAARGVLVESQGPVWFWASASEHAVLYQYQLANASNIFLGHMQTESPYYQPTPSSLDVFPPGAYASDSGFADCYGSAGCLSAWALLISNSRDVFIYGAGFYSWYASYSEACLAGERCQQRLVQTDYSQGIWLYSLYTKGATESVSPLGGIAPVAQADNNNGFLTGASIGGIVAPGNNPTPESLVPMPDLASACGNVACGQTVTLSAACASAIAALPTSGANNNPPGPDNCGEACDIYRLVTGTCCGTGGSACFSIAIPPGVSMPAPFPISSGYKPPASATYSAPGYDASGHPTTSTYDSKHTPPTAIVFPPGWIPFTGTGPPLVVAPLEELPDDPGYSLIIVDQWDDNSWDDTDPTLAGPPPTSTANSPPPPPAATAGIILWAVIESDTGDGGGLETYWAVSDFTNNAYGSCDGAKDGSQEYDQSSKEAHWDD